MGEFDPPGTYRDRGVEGGARAAREDVFEAELRQVRAERAGSLSCCGARNSLLATRSQNFDRCHSLASLLPPPAAVGSLPPPTSLSVQAFSSRRERVHRGFGDDETNGFEIQY